MASSKKKPIALVEEIGTYVYLGPTIRGVVPSGKIFTGTLTEIKATLPLDRFPKIEKLLIRDCDIAEAKRKLKTTSPLSNAYRELVKTKE